MTHLGDGLLESGGRGVGGVLQFGLPRFGMIQVHGKAAAVGVQQSLRTGGHPLIPPTLEKKVDTHLQIVQGAIQRFRSLSGRRTGRNVCH